MSGFPPGADLSKIPLAANPNGDPPNFVDPPSQGATVLAVGLVFAVMSFSFVMLRIYTNLRIVRKLKMDDCTGRPLRNLCFTSIPNLLIP